MRQKPRFPGLRPFGRILACRTGFGRIEELGKLPHKTIFANLSENRQFFQIQAQ
jgi:hypothetical protein